MTGRRGIEDQQVVGVEAVGDQIADAIEEGDLFDPWHRGGELDLPLRFPGDRVAEHARDAGLRIVNVAARFEVRIDFEAEQPRTDLSFVRAEWLLEDVGGRMRGIR